MSRAYATEPERKGWIVPVSVQAIPAILLLVGVPFCIESPRWLIAHGMKDKAIESINKIRPARERESGRTIAEVEGFELAIHESKKRNQGSWKDLFGRSYLNRTIVSIIRWPCLAALQLTSHFPDCRGNVLLPANHWTAVLELVSYLILSIMISTPPISS